MDGERVMSLWLRGLLGVVLVHTFATFSNAEEPQTFRYRFEKGTQLIQQSKTETKTTQTINAMTIDSMVTQSSIEVRTIEELSPEANALIKTKTERLKATSTLGVTGDYEFDSQKPERDKSSVQGAALTPLYERLTGAELNLEITPRGEVKKLTGYAQLVADLIKNNPIAAQFAGGGSDNAAKLGAQAHWLVFPEKAIKPGDKWENPHELELTGLGLIKGKETVTFLQVEKRDGQDIAKFSNSTEITFDLNLDANGAKVTGKVTTSQSSGSSEFNITTGRLVSQKSEMTLTGQLSVEVNNMNIPVELTQTIVNELTGLDTLPE